MGRNRTEPSGFLPSVAGPVGQRESLSASRAATDNAWDHARRQSSDGTPSGARRTHGGSAGDAAGAAPFLEHVELDAVGAVADRQPRLRIGERDLTGGTVVPERS